MAAQICALMPSNPLPLDPASAEGAYELIKENSLPAAVKELLDSVDSFVGRQLADNQSTCFCSYHSDLVKSSENPKQLEDMWILQRDISAQLFKTMMAVMRSAGDLARRYRSSQGNASAMGVSTLDDSDLELAFTGDARGGYQWLNCLARDECDWVWEAVNGDSQSLEAHCPACLLGRAIDSESTIRLLITAARLLKWDFFVDSIQEHLASDPWWGPGYWETIEPKANLLGTQIRELLQQCADIRLKLRELNARECGELVRSTPSRRAVSHGPIGPSVHYSASIPMKVDLRQLHELVDVLANQRSREESISGALRPYNHARMANNYKLAAYCWFVLMYNMSLSPSNTLMPPHDPRVSRVKMRSRTV